MPNKHQIQRDFYRKQKEWKEALKVDVNKETQQSKLTLGNASYNGIPNVRKVKSTNVESQEHKILVEEANRKIAENRAREARAWKNAERYFNGER